MKTNLNYQQDSKSRREAEAEPGLTSQHGGECCRLRRTKLTRQNSYNRILIEEVEKDGGARRQGGNLGVIQICSIVTSWFQVPHRLVSLGYQMPKKEGCSYKYVLVSDDTD